MTPARLLGNALRSPLWLAQLATGAKSFVDNPILGSERLNRRGLHTLRVRLAHGMAAFRRRQMAHLVRPRDRDDFARDGYIRRSDFMPADLHRTVLAEATSVAAEGREQVQGDTLVVRDTVGFHARGPSLRPAVRIEVWAYDRHNPFLPFAGLDLWSMAGLARRRARIEWWLLDRLEQLGLRRNVWRPVGALSADAPPRIV